MEDTKFELVVELQKLSLSSAEPLAWHISPVTHLATDRKQDGQHYAEGVIDIRQGYRHISYIDDLLYRSVTSSQGVVFRRRSAKLDTLEMTAV